MSSHGRTGINQVLLGSQTAIVLAGAKVPVLVAR
jgi:nucleotide-binding universal stress UspA family protein